MNARDIIALFGSTRALGAALGVSRETVKKWAQRGSIPAEHDMALVTAAHERGLPVTLETMARMRADVPSVAS
jgi:DNA-binding transcriptional regulator YiaG